MSITVIKEADTLRVVELSLKVPDGVPVALFTHAELVDPWTAAALTSVFADDADWGTTLDHLVVIEQTTTA